MKTMDASKVRRSFARVLESVRDRQEKIIIVRYGQPIAALVPLSQLGSHERQGVAPNTASSRSGRPRTRLPR